MGRYYKELIDDNGKITVVSETFYDDYDNIISKTCFYENGNIERKWNYHEGKNQNINDVNLLFPVDILQTLSINLNDLCYISYRKDGGIIAFKSKYNNIFIHVDFYENGNILRQDTGKASPICYHNEAGPAKISYHEDGSIKNEMYCVNGKQLTKEEFYKKYPQKQTQATIEQACPICGRMNYIGVNECWNCGGRL